MTPSKPVQIAQVEAIFVRCFSQEWCVVQGEVGRKYNKDYYLRYGLCFNSQQDAFSHAAALADRQRIPESAIFEDDGT